MNWFRITCRNVLWLALSIILLAPSLCHSLDLTEGQHYLELHPKTALSPAALRYLNEQTGSVQVLEFFSYGCYGCSQLHPLMKKWAANRPSDIAFVPVPTIFHPAWEVLARAFYTAQVLKRANQMDEPFFHEILKLRHNLSDERQLKTFFGKFDVSAEDFEKTYYSFEVDRRTHLSKELMRHFLISVTPIVIVRGPKAIYAIEAPRVGSEQALIEALPHLIQKARGGA